MQRGCLTKEAVERFEVEMGKLIVVKKALGLPSSTPRSRTIRNRHTAGRFCSASDPEEFRGALIAMKVGLARWGSKGPIKRAA